MVRVGPSDARLLQGPVVDGQLGQGLCACVPSKQWYSRGGVRNRLGFSKNKVSPNSGHQSRFFKQVVFIQLIHVSTLRDP